MTDRLDAFLEYEEHFHGSDRKECRAERKKAIRTDRSQHKKSDKDQKKKQAPTAPPEGCLQGRVLAIHPEGILVDIQGHKQRCSIKGSLKQNKDTCKNLVAVGDIVYIQEGGQIAGVAPRYSVLSRADNLLRKKEQLIAVNVDLVLITMSVVSPPLKPCLLDRYLIAAQKGNIQPIIVINKIDLLDKGSEEDLLLEQMKNAYEELQIPLLRVSTVTGEGIEDLLLHMKEKTSVFSGQSGTGKSSLINQVTGQELKTGEASVKTGKGSHTTTTTQLLPLAKGGFCIDTPGIRSFGLWDLSSQEVESFFPEIAALAPFCQFPSCRHDKEIGCAVTLAVEENRLSPLRFYSYLQLRESVETKHRHR